MTDLIFNYIAWEDSQGCPAGWKHLPENPLAGIEIPVVHSVGWVMAENEQAVMLSPHVIDGSLEHVDAQAMGTLTIPKRCIVCRREVGMPLLGPPVASHKSGIPGEDDDEKVPM